MLKSFEFWVASFNGCDLIKAGALEREKGWLNKMEEEFYNLLKSK
jgi:hypothetical protein